MDSQTKEVMDILQEECAEVIQAVSKMIEILQELDVVSWANIERAAEAKREKLKIWSNIFTENIIQR